MSVTEEFTSEFIQEIIPANKPKITVRRDMKHTKKIKTKTEKEKIEQIKKRQQRENILKSIRDREEYLELEGKEFIYPNQQDAANKCIEAYKNGAIAVCL